MKMVSGSSRVGFIGLLLVYSLSGVCTLVYSFIVTRKSSLVLSGPCLLCPPFGTSYWLLATKANYVKFNQKLHKSLAVCNWHALAALSHVVSEKIMLLIARFFNVDVALTNPD